MLKNLLLATSLGCLGTAASAQCATLAITGTGAPGTALTFAIDGSVADAFAFVVVGPNAGSTTIGGGPLSLSLGLAAPFIPVPMGMTDASGDASLTVQVPNGALPLITMYAQGVTVSLSLPPVGGPPVGGPPGLTACTMAVGSFQLGS